MPLIKSTSKRAFGENIARERRAGKPEAQSVAIAYATKREAMKRDRKQHASHTGVTSEHAGESHITKRPSNSSSANPKTGASWAEQPMPHSGHGARRSQAYHDSVVSATYTRPSSTKMTKAEHQLNNQEDFSEKGHKL